MTASTSETAGPARSGTCSEPAALRETHTGLVVLFGERAYKIKKPVTTDFLDFATVRAREKACRRELELNRRLAPDVYLGIAHLTGITDGAGEPVLVMRRMPEQRRLATLLTEPGYDTTRLRTLVRTLVEFHRRAQSSPETARAGTAAALRERWQTVLGALRGRSPVIGPGELDAVEDDAMRYISGRIALFEQRIDEGWIVDGHGDLLAQDIFDLPDGFRVLDCLDFDDELRRLDRLDDLAFLAMDLEFLGHPRAAARLLAEYRQFSGDHAPHSLDHHYRAYRAAVRAKVDTIRHDQGDRTAYERARRHLALTQQHLRHGAIRLALVGGLPGTGKTTVAQRLARATGAHALSSDTVRRELIHGGAISGPVGQYDTGVYSPAGRHRVYTELLDRARPLLATGRPVVLDAGWPDVYERRAAAGLAADADAELVQLHCVCPRRLADERLRGRRGGDSDATPELAHAISGSAAPWPEADVLDTRHAPDLVASTAVDMWWRR
ncbi:AAA family ATPase [Nocardia sp. NPDC003963]